MFFYEMSKTFNSSNVEKIDAKNKNVKKIEIENKFVTISSTNQINAQRWKSLKQQNTTKRVAKSLSKFLMFSNDKRFVIWTFETKIEFEQWWKNFSWNVNIMLKTFKHANFLWNNVNRKMKFWAKWHEIVLIEFDKFHIICKNCKFRIVHSTSNNVDSNIMTRHRLISKCDCKKKNKKIQHFNLTENFASMKKISFSISNNIDI